MTGEDSYTRRDVLRAGATAGAASLLPVATARAAGREDDLDTVLAELEEMKELVEADRNRCIDHPNSFLFSMETALLETPEIKERLQDGECAEDVFEAVNGYELLHERFDDKLEVPLLYEGVLDIDLIYLKEHDKELPMEDLVRDVHETYQKHIPDIKFAVEPRVVETDDTQQAWEELQEEYASKKRNSAFENSILQSYLKYYDWDTDCGFDGIAPFDDNWARSGFAGDCHAFHRHGLKHEIGHAAFDLTHTATKSGLLSYHPDAKETQDLSAYSALLLDRYVDGEVTVQQVGDAIEARFEPGAVDKNAADAAFLDHVDQYVRDYVPNHELFSDQDWSEWERTDVTVDEQDGFSSVTYERVVEDTTVTATIGINNMEKQFSYTTE